MKHIPQYGEMVPGRLRGNMRGLCAYIMKACPILDYCLIHGFRRKQKQWEWSPRRYDLLWWQRIETAITQGYDKFS
jgi:hypothetical protein